MSCSYKIRESTHSFTSTEKIIAEYILNNKSEVIEGSAQVMADATGTSAAAWVRFSQKLGYKGFTAMKVDLAKDSDESEEIFNLIIGQEDSLDVMAKKVQQSSFNTIEQTYKLLDLKSLEHFVSCILSSPRTFIVGIGGSGLICNDLMHKLSRIDLPVIYQEDAHVLLARIANIQEGDILLAISHSGETKLINEAVKEAKEQGAIIAAITQFNVTSTLSKMADFKFYTPVEDRELRLGSIASRNAGLILSDLIYYAAAKQNINDTVGKLVKTRKLLKKVD